MWHQSFNISREHLGLKRGTIGEFKTQKQLICFIFTVKFESKRLENIPD